MRDQNEGDAAAAAGGPQIQPSGLLPARLRIATAPTGTIITARPVAAAAAVHSPANSLVW